MTGSAMGMVRAGLVLLALCAFAAAEEESPASPYPPGTTGYSGMPPLMPLHPGDDAFVRSLCDAWTKAGRRARGTRPGGDMLFSAAGALYEYVRDRKRPFGLWSEAFDAYPAQDPTRGVVLMHHARAEMDRGNVPKTRTLVAALEPWEHARRPRDLDPRDEWRWRALTSALHAELPLLRADLHEADGQLLQAAEALAGMLADPAVELQPYARAGRWERVARLRYRGGDRPGSLVAIDRGMEHTDEGTRQRGKLAFWRLHAKHGLVAPHGGTFLPRTWPGDAYERDLRVYLRAIQGVEGLGTTYLTLGSSALMANRLELALEIYLLALRAPDLVEEARRTPMVWRGLLAAVPAAMELGRFDDAARLLSMVERIADEPIEEMDALRIAIRDGRAEDEADKAAQTETATAPEAEAPPEDRSRPLGRIETDSSPAAPGSEDASTPRKGTPRWLWIASAACLMFGLLVLLRKRRS